MSLDILGPASALNSVTARPAQTTTYGATRSWFKACSSLTAQDGTQLTNDFLNNFLAQFRTVFDGAGIVEDNGDDMLWRALEVMALRFAADVGAAGALVVTNTPPVPSYRQGLTLAVVVGNANAGAATINCDSLGIVAINDPTGAALKGGEMAAGRLALLVCDASGNFRLLNGLPPSVAFTLYVNGTTGSDTLYDGTTAVASGSHGPFATIQKAFDVAALYPPNTGLTITIDVAAGTYAPAITPSWAFAPVNLTGAGYATGGSQTLVSGGSSATYCLSIQGPNTVNVSDLCVSLASSSASSPDAIEYAYGAQGTVDQVQWNGGDTTSSFVVAGPNSTVRVKRVYLNGNAGDIIGATGAGANVDLSQAVITLQASITVSGVFCSSYVLASVGTTSNGSTCSFVLGGFTVTGTRYGATVNATINTNGAGASFFPGSVAGYTGSGGQYV